MKLKEKLAQEYANKQSTCPVNDFIAGFQKARELSHQKAESCAIDMDYEDDLSKSEKQSKELDTQYNLACWEIALQIAYLGEEEVE